MATGKKFYWIKLRTSFLDSEKIDFLLSQKNGANYYKGLNMISTSQLLYY